MQRPWLDCLFLFYLKKKEKKSLYITFELSNSLKPELKDQCVRFSIHQPYRKNEQSLHAQQALIRVYILINIPVYVLISMFWISQGLN